jgi:hypothetical protein
MTRGKISGKLRAIEVKTGSATRNAIQLAKDQLLNSVTGLTTFFGRRARAVGYADDTITGQIRTLEVNASNLRK